MKTLLVLAIVPLLAASAVNSQSETPAISEDASVQLLSYYLDESVYHRFLEKNGVEVEVEARSVERLTPLWTGKARPLPVWSAKAVELEDSSSSHFYFFHSNGVSVDRVRWIWNGGASNRPTVVDYFLGGGMFRVFSYVGEKEKADVLSAGSNAPLVLLKDFEFALPGSGVAGANDALSGDYLSHLRCLFDILSKERELIEGDVEPED